jgi:triacylglycerol lipase
MNNNKTLLALCLKSGLLASGNTHAFWFDASSYNAVGLAHGGPSLRSI